MDYLDHVLSSNLFGTFIGWLVFNVVMWRIEKNKHDKLHKPFNLGQYARETYDEWITSAVCVPLILWIGYRSLSLNPLAEGGAAIEWNDLYYLGAGVAPEAIIKLLTKLGIIKNETT